MLLAILVMVRILRNGTVIFSFMNILIYLLQFFSNTDISSTAHWKWKAIRWGRTCQEEQEHFAEDLYRSCSQTKE